MFGSETRGAVVLWGYFWAYILFLYLPILVLALFSFQASETLAFPWQGFSLHWYRAVWTTPGLLDSLWRSLLVAAITAIVAVLLGGAAGAVVTRFRFRGRRLLLALGLIPLIIPPLGLGVALLIAFVTVGIKPSLLTVVVGHSILAVPYVILLVGTRLAGMNPSLEEAAMDLGAGWHRVLRRVYLPFLGPALVTSFIAAFQVSFDEFYLAFFLTGFHPTLPVYFFSGLRRSELLPPAVALTTLVTFVSIVLLLAVQTWVFWREGGFERRRGGRTEPVPA